jgi:exodeoxyribonuclease VII small subunit
MQAGGGGSCDTVARAATLAVPGAADRLLRMAKQLSIEDHFAQIEEAIAALEAGELPLEEALGRYESGLKAVRQARTMLDKYVARLDELRGEPEAPAPSG